MRVLFWLDFRKDILFRNIFDTFLPWIEDGWM